MKVSVEPLDPRQVHAWQQMSPEEKWQVALGLLETATEIRLMALRRDHPEWTEAQVEAELAAERIRAAA